MIRVFLWFAGGYCLLTGIMLMVAAAKNSLRIIPDYIRRSVEKFLHPLNERSTYAIIGGIVLLLGICLFSI